MVSRAVLIKEIETLPSRYYNEVIDFIRFLKEKKVKKTLLMEKAAEMAADEYSNDKELTVFSAIDCDDFYETIY